MGGLNPPNLPSGYATASQRNATLHVITWRAPLAWRPSSSDVQAAGHSARKSEWSCTPVYQWSPCPTVQPEMSVPLSEIYCTYHITDSARTTFIYVCTVLSHWADWVHGWCAMQIDTKSQITLTTWRGKSGRRRRQRWTTDCEWRWV